MNTRPSDFSETDPAPEVPAGLEQLQTWDDPPAATGVQVKPLLPADEADISPLVEEGIEEADRELRLEDETEAEDETISEDTAPPTTGILS
jgi:hypothetical protein